jgi:hypothetical protein
LQTVVDTFGSYAFGFLHTSKQPEAAVAVLYNRVLPFYQDRDIQIEKILTDNGREFCETDSHPFELYLQLNEIKHKRTKPSSKLQSPKRLANKLAERRLVIQPIY